MHFAQQPPEVTAGSLQYKHNMTCWSEQRTNGRRVRGARTKSSLLIINAATNKEIKDDA